ncbi:leucine-rich repeat-containing protein 37B-like [Neofelis nebulosa]|uniref:leucine-rich repeat-containing protein 37B-like n=1 Tax=Neofelis nebulosa TaxID=61452 RepID=UPI00272A5D7E|nr:leucine-rich repeat-containing protein 37B-like [Neofelis nebulosa]
MTFIVKKNKNLQVRLGTKRKAVQHQALALNSSQCQELANYYFGFNGWSKRIIKLQDLSDLEERANEDTVPPLQKQSLKFFCALEVVLPSYECRSPGAGMAEETLDDLEEGPLSFLMKRRTTQKLAIQKAVSDAFQKLLIVILAQMLAPPKELTETLVPFLDTDSVGELPPGPGEDLNDQLTQHQRLPEVVPMPGWDQNQTIAPPPQLKSKTKTVGLDQAEDHQSFEMLVPSLDSQSSKPTKFIASPLNLKEDLAQHRRLAKVVGTPNQFANKEHLQQQLQDDYLDSNMGLLYPEENLPMGFPGGPDQLPNFSEEAEIPPPLQKTPNHLESPEEAESFLPQGEAQAQHPEPPEETETSLLEQKAPSQRPESLKDGNSANPQEAPAEPSSTPEEVEPSSVQQEASAHPTEAPEEVEPSPTPQEAPAQPPEPSKDIISQLLAHHEVNVLSPSQSEAQKPSFPNVTVKPLDLTITLTQPAEHPEEAGPTPVQQEAPAQPAERLEEVEPTPVQQEAPTLVPEFPTAPPKDLERLNLL